MGDDFLAQIRENGAVPRHVAIIMDGNGRWARERSLPRPLGHRAGMKAVREAVEGAIAAGVEVLTLFAFSDENWQRPVTEISALMELLEEYIAKEVAELRGQGVAARALDRSRPADPHLRGAAPLELPAVAARLHRAVHDARALARRDAAGAVPGHPRLSRTRAAVRPGQRAPLMSRNLVVRIAFAVPAIAVTLVALWLGAWVLATLV